MTHTDITDAWLKAKVEDIVESYRLPEGEVHACTSRLIADLEDARTEKNTRYIDAMIARANKHYYHDFLSELPGPIMQLVEDLQALNLGELAKSAMEGRYDAD